MFTEPTAREAGWVSMKFTPEVATLLGYREHFACLANWEAQSLAGVLDPRRTAEFDIGHMPHFGSAGAQAPRGLLS